MTSPFAIAGPRLRENGISALPIRPDGKMPAVFAGGQWRLERDWQRFCARLPTKFEMQIWEKWPSANVGVALGPASGGGGDWQLVAADIDTDDRAVVSAIMSVLPPSPVRKRGRKGECLFYRAPQAVVSRSYSDAQKCRLLDLLAKGRQTVLPPSIHPDTGEPYVWLTPDTLESFDVADLPELPADVADRLGEALAQFGYEPPVVSALGDADLDAERPHRSLNEAALANLDAWVPALNLYGCEKSGNTYKAVAAWRPSSSGRPLHQRGKNLSISPEGIRDFGDCDRGYTPLDLVMAACGADLETSFKWLQDRVAPPANVVVLRPREKPPQGPDSAPVAAEDDGDEALLRLGNAPALSLLAALEKRQREAAERKAQEAELKAVEAAIMAEEAAEQVAAGVIPDELTRPPGLLGEIVDWMTAASSKPSRRLNLGAALSVLGTLMGRRYESPTGARTNVYCLGVAPTGFGKSFPLAASQFVFTRIGLHNFIGGERIKSDAGLLKMLEAKPAVWCGIDEFGGYMKKILDRRAAQHDARQRDLLLSLFSRANSIYSGTEGASERAVILYNPHLCLFGASTPSDLWSAFSSAHAEDGLLPRFLIFDAGEDRVRTVKPTADIANPPEALCKRIRQLMDTRPAGNLNALRAEGNFGTVSPIRAEWGPGAEEWWEAFVADLDDRVYELRQRGKGMDEIVASRMGEHTIKLALICAVGCEFARPVITVEHLEWARGVVEASSAALLSAVEGRIADNDKQAEYLRVRNIIREAGRDGVQRSVLFKRVNGFIDKRRLDEIVAQLVEAEEVQTAIVATRGRNAQVLWFCGAERAA